MANKILMSVTNPAGYKLEELLNQLGVEIMEKSERIAFDKRPQARHVLRNNQQIIGLLLQAEALQRDSFDVMSTLSPDQGPTGTPRIGDGSQP